MASKRQYVASKKPGATAYCKICEGRIDRGTPAISFNFAIDTGRKYAHVRCVKIVQEQMAEVLRTSGIAMPSTEPVDRTEVNLFQEE